MCVSRQVVTGDHGGLVGITSTPGGTLHMTPDDRRILRFVVSSLALNAQPPNPRACSGCGCATDCGPTLDCLPCYDRFRKQRERRGFDVTGRPRERSRAERATSV